MCGALRIEARYNTPDRNGETRREINAKFGQESPSYHIPREGVYLWEWYKDAGSGRRYESGMPQRLTPAEWLAWAELTGNAVRVEEFAVLRDMDAAYIGAIGQELNDQMARQSNGGHSKTGHRG